MPVAPHVSPQSPRYARLVHLCQAYTCLSCHTSGSTHGHHNRSLPLSTIAHISGLPTKGTVPLPVSKRSRSMSSSLPFTPAHQSNPLALPLSPHISLRLQGLALSQLGHTPSFTAPVQVGSLIHSTFSMLTISPISPHVQLRLPLASTPTVV